MTSLREISASLNYAVDVIAVLEHHDGRVVEDVTSRLVMRNSSIDRDNCRVIHGTARLSFTDELPWADHRIRLSIVSTDENTGESVTTPAGLYLMETPARHAGQRPVVWQIDCYDLLTILDVAPSNTVSVADGTSVAEACQTVADMAEAGITLDLAGISGTVRGGRIWPIDDDKLTLLQIINELLVSAAGRELWVDREGRFRSEPWVPIQLAPVLLELDGVSEEATIGQKMSQAQDLWGVPNRWVVIADLPGAGVGIPIDGNGLWTFNNVTDGPTSQRAVGRVIPEIVRVDAVDQAALELEGQRIVEDAQRPSGLVSICTVPAPLFWHRDVVRVTAPDLSFDRTKHVVRSWEFSFDADFLKLSLAGV